MKIEFISTIAGPQGVCRPGDIRDVPKAEAEKRIKEGVAKAAPSSAPVTPKEQISEARTAEAPNEARTSDPAPPSKAESKPKGSG